MKRRLCVVFACLLGGLLPPVLASAPGESGNTAALAKNEVLAHLTENVLQPMAREFARASVALAGRSEAYCRRQAKLNTVQGAWHLAASHWQKLEMIPIGPISEQRLQRHINAWPHRVRLLEPLLNSEPPIQTDQIRRLGAAAKGLPAVEYLLFEKPELLSSHPGRCSALQALTAQISEEAQRLAKEWHDPKGGYSQQLAQAGQLQDRVFASADQTISDIVNLLISGLETVKTRKLGKALEKSTDTAAIERIESWRANASLAHIADNLRGFEAVFFGAGSAGTGLDDYLASVERAGLARVIASQLATARQALAAIHLPLQQALTEQQIGRAHV